VLELHDRGQAIEVISEGEFLQMVGGAPVHMANASSGPAAC
jgi:DNA polymerase-3 subunit epsilon